MTSYGVRGRILKVHVLKLRDLAAVLHVSAVAASAKNAPQTHLPVRVGTSNQRAGGIVDECSQLDGHTALRQRLLEWRDDVLALNTVDVKALGPTLQYAVVDVVLCSWVGEGEAKRQLFQLFALMVPHSSSALPDFSSSGMRYLDWMMSNSPTSSGRRISQTRRLVPPMSRARKTLGELANKVVRDGFQLRRVDGEKILQTTDLTQQVAGHVGHRPLTAGLPLWSEAYHLEGSVLILLAMNVYAGASRLRKSRYVEGRWLLPTGRVSLEVPRISGRMRVGGGGEQLM
ncbi:Hexokinase [Hortaea werneckii]|nr:Hexokinase [Hortaea werneckii]